MLTFLLQHLHHPLDRTSPKDYIYSLDSDYDTPLLHQPLHDHQIPTRSLWIGNIDPALSPSDLLTLYAPFGPIESLRILPDKECAFVNYVRVEDAVRAREEMQGARVGNCVVRVGFGKAEAINDTQGMQPTKSLWVGNIPPTTDPADLEALFALYGPIESARVLTHKNCGFVNFHRLEDAMEARKGMNGKEIGGSVVKIGYAKVPSRADGTPSPGPFTTHSPMRERTLSGGFTYGATAIHSPQMIFSPQNRGSPDRLALNMNMNGGAGFGGVSGGVGGVGVQQEVMESLNMPGAGQGLEGGDFFLSLCGRPIAASGTEDKQEGGSESLEEDEGITLVGLTSRSHPTARHRQEPRR
ncbi:hypothetical protein HK097_003368 [Rhizophlyctis rosea]|uniref:RRM domain-containing protein n=1 Tax=Rhizophlyctis rosea TaxID=64517 RepID=A0AAD5WX97_9FUNG|nr:hypothetical protein HK097_003368 [Rhizophlyctis rosea]